MEGRPDLEGAALDPSSYDGCQIVIIISFSINVYNWDIKFPCNLLHFFKCQSVKNVGVFFFLFSNLQVSSPEMSKNKILNLVKMET